MTNVNLHDWKDNEYGYCLEVYRTRGNSSVPAEHVKAYLRLQMESAFRDGRQDVGAALRFLLVEWCERAAPALGIKHFGED